MIEVPQERLALLDSATLSNGAHDDGKETCARELIHLVVTGEHADQTPECLTAALACLPPLNDGPWRNDEHRTSTLRPWLRALLGCERDDAKDLRIAYRLADLAVREIAPEALDAAGMAKDAEKLRTLPHIVDDETAARAAAAAESARAAAREARAAARAARAAAAEAAWAAAAESARAAAREARAAAAVDVFERWTVRILGVICEEYGVAGPGAEEVTS